MVKLGIIGAGGMANAHAEHFQKDPNCQVVAVCDVDLQRAKDFAGKHGIEAAYGDLQTMLAETELDAVTNVTPDPFHKDTSLAAIAAGKHILCEKPLAVNEADAAAMAAAAQDKGVINMVNLSYRNSSAIQRARELITEGRIGRIMHLEASYLQSWLSSKIWGDWRTETQWLWRLSNQHGSKGVLGDVGIHILDFASFPVGDIRSVNCKLKCFDKAENNRIGVYPLDANDSALIQVEFANGALGTVHTTRWATGQENSLRLRIYGDRGAISIDLDESWDSLRLCSGDGVDRAEWVAMQCVETPTIYQRFIRSIERGINDQPDFSQGWRLQSVLDACFASDAQGNAIEIGSASHPERCK